MRLADAPLPLRVTVTPLLMVVMWAMFRRPLAIIDAVVDGFDVLALVGVVLGVEYLLAFAAAGVLLGIVGPYVDFQKLRRRRRLR